MLPKHRLVVQDGIEREFRVTEALVASIGKIEAAPAFPKNAPWSKGVFPVLPILETYESTLVIVLTQPPVLPDLQVLPGWSHPSNSCAAEMSFILEAK